MTTSVYNRQSLNKSAVILPISPIDDRIESEAASEGTSQFLISIASFSTNSRARACKNDHFNQGWDASDYYRNKYGDSFAGYDELGFEQSYMGSRADYNHII